MPPTKEMMALFPASIKKEYTLISVHIRGGAESEVGGYGAEYHNPDDLLLEG
ncbi:hypothetical protein IMZ48_46335 [Candidatus Bathyarchaeota archaeon]|nr:hypothetical protein [Candidatus Bathyarchaeota archaeon]